MRRVVTSNTSIYGLIGCPLEHSISPQIQNAAYAEMGLDAIYVPLHLRGRDIPDLVSAARDIGISGLNVTIPYKSAVISALDWIDEVADMIGAVNVIHLGDEIRGYNTDVTASMQSLREVSGPLAGKRVMLVGAGGSARAVAFGLVREKASLSIANRTLERAQSLASDIISTHPGVDIRVLDLGAMAAELGNQDVLINATPVGMYPRIGDSIVAPDSLRPDLTVMDLVYNPRDTMLLERARQAGCRTVGGLRMLVYQAAESIEIWTGLEPPVEVMMSAATEAMSEFRTDTKISTN